MSAAHDDAWTDVAALADLPEGTLLGVALPGGGEVCVFNQGGTIGAMANRCSHAEFRLSEGALHGDGTLECAWHGGRFDCATGAARRAPAIDPVPVYPVRIDGARVLVGRAPTSGRGEAP